MHGKLEGMQKITRISAGVKFESDVLVFIDRLAREQQRSRSFIINAIVRWYRRRMEEELRKVEPQKMPEPVIRL